MVNFFDLGVQMMHGIKNIGKPSFLYTVFESQLPQEVQAETPPQNMLAVFTAAKILSGSISQMNIEITKDNKEYSDFPMYYSLKYRMNDIQNNQSFYSTLEYHRSVYGNAFVDIRKDRNEIIHPSIITDYDFKGVKNSLRFFVEWSKEEHTIQKKYKERRADEWVSSKDLLHFKGMSIDGIFGLPPVSAAAQAMGILDNASNTVVSFYKNRAMSPMALETTIESAAGAKATLEGLETFNKKYTGSFNAGKTVQLPPNTKLTPLSIQFRDAELIDTMKFSKEEIMVMYGIPAAFYKHSEMQTDVEQQSLSFKTFTLAPIAAIYEEELAYKLLSKEDRLNGITIVMNMDSLLVADLKSKAESYRSLVTAGIISPNEAAKALGFEIGENKWLDYRYLQSQNIPIELYDVYGKVNPNLIKPTNETNK